LQRLTDCLRASMVDRTDPAVDRALLAFENGDHPRRRLVHEAISELRGFIRTALEDMGDLSMIASDPVPSPPFAELTAVFEAFRVRLISLLPFSCINFFF
jgi:hypothetical protein